MKTTNKIAAVCISLLLTMGLGVGGATIAYANDNPNAGEKVCENLDTGHLSGGSGNTFIYTAPAGKLVDYYCVKAGSSNQGEGNGPVIVEVNPNVATVTIDHPVRDSISHFSVKWVDGEAPVTVRINLTYIMDCAPDPYNTYRVRNPHTETITVSWRNASNTLSGTHSATPGDSFFETPRGTETMIISWGGGNTGIVAGTQTKASGNDVATSDPKCKPADKVEYGDWVTGKYDCDDTQVTETREVYTTTYSLVNGQWVGNTVGTTEDRTRDLTAEEIHALFCPGPEPEDKVTFSEWVDGEYACGDTTVEQTRTKTTTSFVLEGEEWVEGASSQVIETQTRLLTEQEISALDCSVPDTLAETGFNARGVLIASILGLVLAAVGVLALLWKRHNERS